MRIDSDTQAPLQPVRERQARPVAEPREKAARIEKEVPEPPKAEGSVGRNLDTQA